MQLSVGLSDRVRANMEANGVRNPFTAGLLAAVWSDDPMGVVAIARRKRAA
jgi:hypothetical protein